MGRRRRTAAAAAAAPKSDVEAVKENAAAVLARRSDAEARVLARLDRWMNPATGLGTLEDKTRAAHFEFPFRLMDQEITSLVSGNPLAAKIVEKRPAEMFRQGYTMTAKAKGGSGAQGGADKSQIEDLQSYAERLNLDLRMRQGMTYGRQYGGSLLLLGIQDGRQPWQPVDEQNIQSIRFINQIDRRFAYVQSYYSDYMRPKYGDAQTYLVANGVATSSYQSRDQETFRYRKKSRGQLQTDGYSVLTIHESRVIRFDGIEPDVLTRQTLAGWSWSVLQRVYETLRLCDGSFEALCYLISDASQGVIKLKGLFEAMSSGNEDKMQSRLQMIEDMRSVMRSIALDTDGGEDFTRVTTPLTGIPDSIDRIMQWLAAACDMPVTELFGISPAGLNATGESDRIKWYDTIKVEQKNYLSPKLKHLYRLISLAHDSPFRGQPTKFDIEFHSLYAPTDSELAKTRLANAQRDQIYTTIEAITPEKVALTLTDVYPSIDPEEIEDEIDQKTKFDPYEKDPIESATAQNKVQQQQAMAKTKALHAAAKAKLASQPNGPAEGAGVPEGQSPTVPLPAGQLKTNTKSPDNGVQQKSDAASKADEVHQQLSSDFPPRAISWVKGVKWRGPVRVPLGKVDFSGKDKWQASREPDRVEMHANRIEKGREKPVILVQRPGDTKLPVTDGHHRSLAYLQRKEPVLAYIGEVHSAEGPWDEMHSAQKEGGFEESAQIRRDYDPDQPREANGEFGSGGGSGASARPAAEYTKQSDPRFKALKHVAGVLRSVPRALGRAVVDEVKEKIEDAKGAYHGVSHFLQGKPVSPEEKKAIKHVVLTVAAGVLAGHLTPLLHLSGLVGEQGGEWAEHVADQCLHHVVEKFSKRFLRLDAAGSRADADPTEWLAEGITQAIADALDQVHEELPLGAPRADYDPDQARDERGQWTSGGGGGSGKGRAAAALSPKALQTERQPYNTYTKPEPTRTPGKELAAEETQLSTEQETDELFTQAIGTPAPPAHVDVPGYGAKNNPELVSKRIAEPLVQRAATQGGFSYRPGAKSPKTGYMVSLPTSAGLNHVVDIESIAHREPPPTEKELRAEVSGRVRDWLRSTLPTVTKNPEHYLGGWLQKGEDGKPVALHLDVSQRFTDHDKATAAGRERNQIAIWQLDDGGKEIPTGGTGK